MTSVNEKIFRLDKPNYISYNIRKRDYLRIAPTTGTANNLNQGGISKMDLRRFIKYCKEHFGYAALEK